MTRGLRTIAGAVGILAGSLASVLALPSAAGAAPPVPPPPGAIVTGASGPYCPSPAYPTIQGAIDAATAGATIYVCSGTYDESPVIDKPLTLDGAQFDVDARTRTGSDETVISGAGGITYTAGATGGTVNGFTLEGSGGTAAEINASGTGAGWQFINNVVDVSNGGIVLDTGGAANPPSSSIAQNNFTQATPSAAPTGHAGQAVVLGPGTANNVTIAANVLANLSGPGAAIDTTGTGTCGATLDATQLSANVRIVLNGLSEDGASFVDPINGTGYTDEPFLNLVCTNQAHACVNTVTVTDVADANRQGCDQRRRW